MTYDFSQWRYPSLDEGRVEVLGDPHLGRLFRQGVPLHRRGEREELVFQHFEWALRDVSSLYHVCMGDLFHRPDMPAGVILRAASAYREAAVRCPHTRFVVLAGNHDLSRDTSHVSAFHLFEALLAPLPNVRVVHEDAIQIGGYLFVPWSPTRTSREMVAPWLETPLDAVFGHWDVVNPMSDANMVPTLPLAKMILTGHDHLRRDVGEKVRVVGSMQPYAHGEDWTGAMYQTVLLDEIPADPRMMCLRIVGDAIPADLDALQITLQPPRAEEGSAPEITLEGFDMRSTWMEAFAEFGVSAKLRDELFDRFSQQEA